MIYTSLQLCSRGIAMSYPSVRPSVCQMREYCDKTKETSARILISYETLMPLVLRHEERMAEDVPFYL